MRWSERQQAQLREMGLRLWLPAGGAANGEAAAGVAEVTKPPERLPHAPPVATILPASVPTGAARAAPGAPRAGPVARPAAAAPAAPGPVIRPAGTGTGTGTDAAVAGLDWPALREAVAGCRACSLCDSRQQTVFGVGHQRAHLMIVGEAPGEQEDAQGEPFVGAAGQLLDRMLAALGLTRAEAPPARQVFIANTLKCRPPRNRNPSPVELAACHPFLARQVALVQPRVILAMGRFAVQSLLGSDAPLGKLRGQLHDWHGVPLVATYHPAYLLRQPADKARAWEDLCLAAACLDGTVA